MSHTEFIDEAVADFSAMTPTLKAVVTFDGSWHRGGASIAEGSVQLVIDDEMVGEIPIVGDEDVINSYSATFTGIANPGPGVVWVTALLVLVSPSSTITVNNVVVTITCEGSGVEDADIDSPKCKIIQSLMPPVYKRGKDEILMKLLCTIADSDQDIGG